MSLVSKSLGSVLQGISQQPARVRREGQVARQLNLESNVTVGLTTRPSTTQSALLPGATLDMTVRDIRYQGQDLLIGHREGELKLWDLDGTEYPVAYRNGGVPSYIGDDMRFHVVDGHILLVNRQQVVAIKESTSIPVFGTALFHALGGQFLRTYSVEVTFEDDTVIYGEYTTPDGTDDDDAEHTASEVIVSTVATQLLADVNLPAGTVIMTIDDVGLIYHPTMKMTIKVSDGEGGTVFRGTSGDVDDAEDVPRWAPHGTVVRVTSSDASEDDFFLRFSQKADDDVVLVEDGQSGFGKEGTWIEWYDNTEDRELDRDTMPHILIVDDGDWFIQHGPWVPRSVGDSESSPFPSIVDKKIRDVAGFESRLLLLSQSSVVMSRTNKPFDLFRETATTLAQTDPVDITSTKKDELALDWLVPFDRDMVVIADPGDSQFVIRGGGINSVNASMVLTTEFSASSAGAAPVSAGKSILFPFTTGIYSGIKEFFATENDGADTAVTLTEAQDKLLLGPVSGIAMSQNFNTALFRTTDSPRSLYVYKFLWDGEQLVQSSWGIWQFLDSIEHAFFRDSTLWLCSRDLDGTMFLHYLNMNRPVGPFGYHFSLDREVETTVMGEVDLPYGNARFVQGDGTLNPGREVRPLTEIRMGSAIYRYTFDPVDVPDGSKLFSGQAVEWELELTQVFAKDHQDRVDTSREVHIDNYTVVLADSGPVTGRVSSPYFDTWEHTEEPFPMEDNPLDPTGLLLTSGPVSLPFGEQADNATMTLTGHDIRPVTILEVAWTGQVLQRRGHRV